MTRGERLRSATERARRRAARTRAALDRQRVALAFRRKRTAELLKQYQIHKDLPTLKRFRISRGLASASAHMLQKIGNQFERDNAARAKWEKLLRAFRIARRNPYPHLSGDLDALPAVLERLERLAKHIGRNLYVTSGRRSEAEQKALWDNRASNPFPVAFCCPCSSEHCLGRAADVLVGGAPIQYVVPAAFIREAGLVPLAGDAVHVQLP